MKTLAHSIIVVCIILLCDYNIYAQSDHNINSQNPRHRESEEKYAKQVDALTKNQGTTVQQTYKAFDWYEDKMNKKAQKDLWRHQERMERAKNGSLYYYDSWGFPYYYSSPWIGINPYINYRGTNWGFGLMF